MKELGYHAGYRFAHDSPDAYLPLQVLAEDDFGVSSMRLIVDRIGVRDPLRRNSATLSGCGITCG